MDPGENISACLKTIFMGNRDDLKTAPKALVHRFCLNQPALGRAHKWHPTLNVINSMPRILSAARKRQR